MHTVLDTSRLDPSDRLEAWGTIMSRRAVTFRTRDNDAASFHGLIRGSQVGPLAINYFHSSSQLINRTDRLSARHEDDHCKVMLQLSGTSTVRQGGRVAELRPGDLTLCDHGRPYTLGVNGRVRMLIMLFPRPLLDSSLDRLGAVTANSVHGGEGVGAVLSGYLTSVARRLDECSTTAAERLATNAVALVDTLIEEMLETSSTARQDPHHAMLLRIQAYIDQNLGDPELSLDDVAAAHNVSRRHLYNLFAGRGWTVAQWIRERRLQGCARDLASRTLAHEGVRAIGYRWGLPNPANFSRMFKRAYGLTPSDYRHAMLEGTVPGL